MEIYSYTDSKYQRPPEDLFGKKWPVQFSEPYALFQKQFYGHQILHLYDKASRAWIPLDTYTAKFVKFGQLLHPPMLAEIELSARDQQFLFDRLLINLRKHKIIHRLLQPHPSCVLLAAPQDCKSVPFGTYITDLTGYDNDESLLNSFDPKYKKAIQHSIKNKAKIIFGEKCYDDFYHIYKTTAQRNKVHVDKESYFEQIRKNLGPEGSATAVVYEGNKPIGCLFTVYSHYAALCTHAGSNGPSPLYGANKYLHFEMMKLLKSKGVRYYDLVGVRLNNQDPNLEGIFKFKQGFGGELKQGYLWKSDLQPKTLRLYDWIQRLRKINVHGDIIDKVNTYQIS